MCQYLIQQSHQYGQNHRNKRQRGEWPQTVMRQILHSQDPTPGILTEGMQVPVEIVLVAQGPLGHTGQAESEFDAALPFLSPCCSQWMA
jgi:hypothetical protein